jgi:CRP/FNR family transcriptional regulator, cyclic AMP receptor protein
MTCDPAFLGDVPLFKLLDAAERASLAAALEARHVAQGEELFRYGEPGDQMFIIRRGSVEIYAQDLMGQKIVLETVGAGGQFGELALFDGGARTATAAALEECDVLSLDREDLLRFLRSHPDAGLDMLAIMARRIRETNARLRHMTARNVNEAMEEKLTAVQRAADWVAAFSGSISFLMLHVGLFAIWIGWNVLLPAFDPYPFGLLTMAVSLEAIVLSVLVLLSQNRQAAKDHIHSDIEYEVNLKAELEVAHLHDKVDRLGEGIASRLARLEKLLTHARAPSE